MVRQAGALLVFASCTAAGFFKSLSLKRRERYLVNVGAFLNMLDVRIQFSSDRLERCMREGAEHTDLGGLLEYAVEHMRDDGIRCAWSDSVRINTPYLTDEDRDILSSLGAQLGMTDREGQYKNISCTRALIEGQYEKAKRERETLSRLYEGGGILAGVFAVLMLM